MDHFSDLFKQKRCPAVNRAAGPDTLNLFCMWKRWHLHTWKHLRHESSTTIGQLMSHRDIWMRYTCIFLGLKANKSMNNFPPLWSNCYWILLKWSPLFLWKDWCLLLPRVWRILPVKSELLVYRGHWLLPSYISIKNVGVTLTLSYCAAGTRSSSSDSRAGE